jgi:hypothetical protein
MYQVVKMTFAAGLAVAILSIAPWRPAGSTVTPVAGQTPLGGAEPARIVPACGGKVAPVWPETRAPLPNAYMVANGRLFTLADVFACVNRLHTARIS